MEQQLQKIESNPLSFISVSIILEFHPSEEKEMIPDLQTPLTKNNELNLFNLLLQLKQMGFLVENCMISYWSPSSEMFVFCGYDPVPKYIVIPLEDFFAERKIILKVKQINRSLLHILMSDDIQKQEIQNDVIFYWLIINNKDPGDDVSEMEDLTKEKNKTQNDQSQIKCRRTKERKIGFIIEKVSHWRRYYTGDLKDDGKETRLSLEDAAKKVQISKKSLDDYLLQIRLGRKFGFNFNEHYNDKVGVLRAFVKKNKQQPTKQIKKKKA